jgi:hypothetical protein
LLSAVFVRLQRATGLSVDLADETFEQGRRAVDATLFRLRPVESGGTVTELRAAR